MNPSWPDPAQAAIRPGIAIQPDPIGLPENEGGNFTANFLFRTPLNRTLYLGTAGHCVNGTKTTELTANGIYEARVAWSAHDETLDFALLALDDTDRDEVHPNSCTGEARPVSTRNPASAPTSSCTGARSSAAGTTRLARWKATSPSGATTAATPRSPARRLATPARRRSPTTAPPWES